LPISFWLLEKIQSTVKTFKRKKGKPSYSAVKDRSEDFPFLSLDHGYNPGHADYAELFPGRSSGSWIVLLTAPSPDSQSISKWLSAVFIPTYSGGPAPDFNGVPYCAVSGT